MKCFISADLARCRTDSPEYFFIVTSAPADNSRRTVVMLSASTASWIGLYSNIHWQPINDFIYTQWHTLSTNQRLHLYTMTYILHQSMASSVHIDTHCQSINGFVCTQWHTLTTNQRLHLYRMTYILNQSAALSVHNDTTLWTNQQLHLYTMTHILHQSMASSVHIDIHCQPINSFLCTHWHILSTNQYIHLYTLTHIVNQSMASSVHIATHCQPINGFITYYLYRSKTCFTLFCYELLALVTVAFYVQMRDAFIHSLLYVWRQWLSY